MASLKTENPEYKRDDTLFQNAYFEVEIVTQKVSITLYSDNNEPSIIISVADSHKLHAIRIACFRFIQSFDKSQITPISNSLNTIL